MINVRSDLTPHTLSSWESCGVWIITFGEKKWHVSDLKLKKTSHPSTLYKALWSVYHKYLGDTALLWWDSRILVFQVKEKKPASASPPGEPGGGLSSPTSTTSTTASRTPESTISSKFTTANFTGTVKNKNNTSQLHAESHGATSACTVKSLI